MFVRTLLPAITALAAVAAAPAAAVTTFNFGGTVGNVAEIVLPGNFGTVTAKALRYSILPSALASFGNFDVTGDLSRQTMGIGVVGGADSNQLDTNQASNRQAILLTGSQAFRLSGFRLSAVDADDTLSIFGVNANNNSLTLIGFGGPIRTNLSGVLTNTSTGGNGGTNAITIAPTDLFSSFIFTTALPGNNGATGFVGGQGFRIDSVTGFVPEPGTWAMLVLGFGLVGATARRRRPHSVVA